MLCASILDQKNIWCFKKFCAQTSSLVVKDLIQFVHFWYLITMFGCSNISKNWCFLYLNHMLITSLLLLCWYTLVTKFEWPRLFASWDFEVLTSHVTAKRQHSIKILLLYPLSNFSFMILRKYYICTVEPLVYWLLKIFL